ncbi:nitroreductase family deazaflavin-dependent oxidoreductase [Streptomyces sp. WMMB303]|uniref:nitroreductase family deazaflavin-dependent oxidoreductase n=2 Tax=unclassified Streptomyces TaxID=2593676 RepID=UPI0023ECE220|nr:nitroreductase family deazaflavin-dependent oxidoreductase [Streptomyces sp. WMMB303]MDF4253656.1 nitroreductase family deazaflavin-dependent oxidoreductase [Streptomyces sp. WMMB303]
MKGTVMEIVKRPAPPTGIRRMLFRAPIHLYRLRLGWLFGGRLLLLNHTGRVSGKPRRVVIEVVEHDRTDGSYVVCSGFGPEAAWYRNLLATPEASIQVGVRTLPVTAHPLDTEEGGDFMARYAPRHPRTARKLVRFMGFSVDGTQEDYRAVGRKLPFVRLSPRKP